MIDESTSNMEKKSSSTRSQSSSKPAASDSKKTTDTQNVKPFPRSTRKREPVGSSGNPSKNEPRRPAPHKGKAADKRPKRRGCYYGPKKENQVKEFELEPEFESLFPRGSKKHNLNHLLNFHFEPRELSSTSSSHQFQHNAVSTKTLLSTQTHKFNKEQFLQANCQFVVRADEDYGCYLGNPDQLVDWSLIELVRFDSREAVACPICLNFPTAGKMTRCGHIYCWTCILHYLALSDKSWRKCPICFEAVHMKDLKSVQCIEKTSYAIGSDITLQLMKREKGSLIASPVAQFDQRMKHAILNLSEKTMDTHFSKLLLAQPSDVDLIIEEEYRQLQSHVAEYKGCPEYCFVEQALELLALRKSLLHSQRDEAEKTCCQPDKNPDKAAPSPKASKSAPGKSEDYYPDSNIALEDVLIDSKTNHQPKYFYFYQSTDGQHIYLHSMNVHMLEMTYGTLEKCPDLIQGRIVEKETGSLTGELRKRLRYLQHLPITCQFEVVEIDLSLPLVSEETLKEFESQIEARKKRRSLAARAEKKREKKIEEITRRQFGRQSSPNVDLRIESHLHFPECGEQLLDSNGPSFSGFSDNHQSDASSRPGSPSLRSASPSSLSFASLSLDQPASSPQDHSGVSFAQMLRVGKPIKTDNCAWPSIGNSNPRRQRQRSVTIDSDPEGGYAAFSPPALPSFNFAAALEAASRIEKAPTTSGSKKKKNKQQHKILFSTGMTSNLD